MVDSDKFIRNLVNTGNHLANQSVPSLGEQESQSPDLSSRHLVLLSLCCLLYLSIHGTGRRCQHGVQSTSPILLGFDSRYGTSSIS